jgi:uncharacterized protein (TIGR02594 family)
MNPNQEFTHHYLKDKTPEQKAAEARIVQSTYKVLADELDKQKEINAAHARSKMLCWCIVAVTVIIIVLGVWFSKAHADVVSVARQEIGRGELIFDNFGPDVARYMQGRQGQPWCAGFVSYCLLKSGYKLPYTFRSRTFLDYGKKVSSPKPGDLAVFARGKGGHAGIVESCAGNKVIVIEGNTGKAPSQVRRIVYNGTPKNLLGWVRLTGGAR